MKFHNKKLIYISDEREKFSDSLDPDEERIWLNDYLDDSQKIDKAYIYKIILAIYDAERKISYEDVERLIAEKKRWIYMFFSDNILKFQDENEKDIDEEDLKIIKKVPILNVEIFKSAEES